MHCLNNVCVLSFGARKHAKGEERKAESEGVDRKAEAEQNLSTQEEEALHCARESAHAHEGKREKDCGGPVPEYGGGG